MYMCIVTDKIKEKKILLSVFANCKAVFTNILVILEEKIESEGQKSICSWCWCAVPLLIEISVTYFN